MAQGVHVTDIDALVAADEKVRFGGKTFPVPSDPPNELVFRQIQVTEKLSKLENDQGATEADAQDLVELLERNVLDYVNLVPKRDGKRLHKALPTGLGLQKLLLVGGCIVSGPGTLRGNPQKPVRGDRQKATRRTGSKPRRKSGS